MKKVIILSCFLIFLSASYIFFNNYVIADERHCIGLTSSSITNSFSSKGIDFTKMPTDNNPVRYVVLPDYDDSTGWYNSKVISATNHSDVFSTSSDIDYYTYTAPYSRTVYISISGMTSGEDAYIFIYKGSTSNLVSSYLNSKSKTYSVFIDNLVFVEKNETIYIETSSVYDGTYYDICVVEVPNLSGYETYITNGYADECYPSGTTSLTYKIDSSLYSTIYDSNFSYYTSFIEAINIWNKVGNLYLNYTTGSNYDILVSTASLSYLASQNGTDTVGLCTYGKEYEGALWWKKSMYKAYNIYVASNFETDSSILTNIYAQASGNGISSSDATYYYILGVFVHEIGHSLGLDHMPYNCIMYPNATCYTQLGDADIAGYLSLWGNI